VASSTHFNVRAGLSTSVQLSRADRRKLQVFEEHLLKHNPAQHGHRLCQRCEEILGEGFEAESVLPDGPSWPSGSSRSGSLSSQSRHSDRCRSYLADVSSAASSRDSFVFPCEATGPPRLVGPVRLADIEYYTDGPSEQRSRKKHQFRSRGARSESPGGGKHKQLKIPKTQKPCVHNLAKKHRSCGDCYECKQCKDMFLKKESREKRSTGRRKEGGGRCSTCHTMNVPPASQFVDCIID
jgi:hypothetical protein